MSKSFKASTTRVLPVIYNPSAGQRHGRRLSSVLAALEQLGWRVELRTTAGPGDAERLALEALASGVVRLAVAGGDGTVHEVVNGLAASGITNTGPQIGIIPLGTANVLAAEIGLPRTAAGIAACLVEGGIREVRLGEVRFGNSGQRYFILMAGVGFDAEVVARVSSDLKRRLGKGAYVWESLRLAFRYAYPAFSVVRDGKVETAHAIIAARSSRYGGHYLLTPAAGLSAPKLQACLFTRRGPMAVLCYGAALLAGKLFRRSDLKVIAFDELRVTSPIGQPVQADGDSIGMTPVSVSLSEHRVRLTVPA